MGSSKGRAAEKNLGLFLSPTLPGGGGFLVPMNNLNVGPGEPGPGDEWEVPSEPIDGTAGEAVATTEPAGSAKEGPQQPDR